VHALYAQLIQDLAGSENILCFDADQRPQNVHMEILQGLNKEWSF